jgi:arsenate reductase (thioredoxin)
VHVLFLCPHGAAKSVIAAAMFNELTRRRHLEITAASAGTEPDDKINPVTIETLLTQQLPIPDAPQLVTKHEIERADVVVSFGCAIDRLPTRPKGWVDWSDAPAASEDIEGLCELLRNRLETLLP